MRWNTLLAGLRNTDVNRMRRAFALLPLAAFVLLYGLLAFSLDPSWRPAFIGLALCYLVAFVALGSEWFWARWYCVGLAWSGFMVGVYGMVSVGVMAPLVIYAALHGSVVLLLRGEKLAALYEGQSGWRERYNLDEHGAGRVGKAVSRASGALPTLVIWALAPKQPESLGVFGHGGSLVGHAAAVAALILALFGIFYILRGRSLGVCCVVAACLSALIAFPLVGATATLGLPGSAAPLGQSLVAVAALCGAVLPLAGPLLKYVRGR